MIRKALIIISVLAAAMQMSMAANGWYKYPLYRDKIDNVKAGPDKVYYISDGSLFSFSPSDNESYSYDNLNKLNDVDIHNIYYNPEKKYLAVVYDNSNIDLLFDDGRVISLPDIKNASVSTSRTINHVAFGRDRIAVSTDFGFVIFSDERFEVIESGILNKKVDCMGIIGDRLLLFAKSISWNLYMAPLEGRHNNIEKFSPMFSFGIGSFSVVDNNHIAVRENSSNKLLFWELNFDTPSRKDVPLGGTYKVSGDPTPYKDGVYAVVSDKIIFMKKDGLTESVDLPEILRDTQIGIYDSVSKLWSGSPDGIAQYNITTTPPTMLFDRMLADGYITDKYVSYMKWSADGERLYISNQEATVVHSYGGGDLSTNYQTTNIISNGDPTDVSLKNASADHSSVINMIKPLKSTRMFGSPCSVVEDPNDPDKYYCATYMEGVYVIKLNTNTGEYEEIGKFNDTNAPFGYDWSVRAMAVDFDRDGNLWVGTQNTPFIYILPNSKVKQDPKSIKAEDWRVHRSPATDCRSKDMSILLCKHSDMVFYKTSDYEKGIVAIDTKGTWGNPDDDVIYQTKEFIDQDGNTVKYDRTMFLLEDSRGCVWVGTNAGVFEITHPTDATSHSMTIRRIKVPRNDGTNYADYLLSSDKINWMCEDPAGRKWIATDVSGLYLVSETGDKIIRNYNTQNSSLPSNTICTVECDKKDNTVYVGTTSGLYTFKSDASSGHSDYAEIYAYPNPVRPEYSGMVTISGLVANSIVKITDTTGNVIYETRSEGGMASWDACGPDGNRVKTGVYYVYATESNSGGQSTGAVTKILVIN